MDYINTMRCLIGDTVNKIFMVSEEVSNINKIVDLHNKKYEYDYEKTIELVEAMKKLIFDDNTKNEIKRVNLSKVQTEMYKVLSEIEQTITKKSKKREWEKYNKGILKLLNYKKLKYYDYNYLLTIKDLKRSGEKGSGKTGSGEKGQTDKKLLNLDFFILGTKLNNVGTLLNNFLHTNEIFNYILYALKYLDVFFYISDDNGKEIEYTFTKMCFRLQSKPFTLDDINLLTELALSLLLMDILPSFQDTFIEKDYVEKYHNDETITVKTINNPLNLLIYMDNEKITLPPGLKNKLIGSTNNTFFNLVKSGIGYFSLNTITSIRGFISRVHKTNINPKYYTSFSICMIDILESYDLIYADMYFINSIIIFIKTNNIFINKNTQQGGDFGIISGVAIPASVVLLKYLYKKKVHTCIIKSISLKYQDYQINDINNLTYQKFSELISTNDEYKAYYNNSLISFIENEKYPLLLEILLNYPLTKNVQHAGGLIKNTTQENLRNNIRKLIDGISNKYKKINPTKSKDDEKIKFKKEVNKNFLENLIIFQDIFENLITNLVSNIDIKVLNNVFQIIPLFLNIEKVAKSDVLLIKTILANLRNLTPKSRDIIRKFIITIVLYINMFYYYINYCCKGNKGFQTRYEITNITEIFDKIGKLIQKDFNKLNNVIIHIALHQTFTKAEIGMLKGYDAFKNILDNDDEYDIFNNAEKTIVENIFSEIIETKGGEELLLDNILNYTIKKYKKPLYKGGSSSKGENHESGTFHTAESDTFHTVESDPFLSVNSTPEAKKVAQPKRTPNFENRKLKRRVSEGNKVVKKPKHKQRSLSKNHKVKVPKNKYKKRKTPVIHKSDPIKNVKVPQHKHIKSLPKGFKYSKNSFLTPPESLASTPMATPIATPMVTPMATPMVTPMATPMVTPMATPMATPVTSINDINENVTSFIEIPIETDDSFHTDIGELDNSFHSANNNKHGLDNKINSFYSRLNVLIAYLFEWQFVVSHAYIEHSLQYTIHPQYNYLISPEIHNLFGIIKNINNYKTYKNTVNQEVVNKIKLAHLLQRKKTLKKPKKTYNAKLLKQNYKKIEFINL
jgi:hypothetical protein